MRKSDFVNRSAGRLAVRTSILFLLSFGSLFAKDFTMPSARQARAYPAHDEHSMEKVTVAVDPYDMGDKAQIFSTDFSRYGYLPVFFIVTNDGDTPVSLGNIKAQLVTVKRVKLSPATNDDLLRRMSHPTPKLGASPLPLPGKKVKGGVDQKTREEIEQAQFGARAVEPHSTVSGFLFFDVADIPSPALAGANFYLTGVHDSSGNELMYFEIPMEKYLSAPQAK